MIRRRGAPYAAAELAAMARRLTPRNDAEELARRTIDAAEYHLDAGDAPHARSLLEDLLPTLPGGLIRARALERLGWVRYHEDSWAAAARLFDEALGEAEAEPMLSASVALDSSVAALLSGNLPLAASHARAALAMAEELGQPTVVADAKALAGSV